MTSNAVIFPRWTAQEISHTEPFVLFSLNINIIVLRGFKSIKLHKVIVKQKSIFKINPTSTLWKTINGETKLIPPD